MMGLLQAYPRFDGGRMTGELQSCSQILAVER